MREKLLRVPLINKPENVNRPVSQCALTALKVEIEIHDIPFAALEVTCDVLIGAEGGVADPDGVRRRARLRRDAVLRGHVHTLGGRSSGRISRYRRPNLEPKSHKEHDLHVNTDRGEDARRRPETEREWWI